jgi:uncharacterized protein (DUF2252 family)
MLTPEQKRQWDDAVYLAWKSPDPAVLTLAVPATLLLAVAKHMAQREVEHEAVQALQEAFEDDAVQGEEYEEVIGNLFAVHATEMPGAFGADHIVDANKMVEEGASDV